MSRSSFENLVHCVNNLLGTIQMQTDVARALGTLQAHVEALRMIEESGRRAQSEVQRLRAEAARETDAPDADEVTGAN